MNEPELDAIPQSMVRRLQIVIAALVAGVLMAAAVFFVLRTQGPAPLANQFPLVSCMAVAFAVMMLAVRAVMVPVVAKSGRQKLLANPEVTTIQLMNLYSGRTIVGAALLEGAAFFLLVAYLTEGQPWAFAGGLIIAGLIAVLQFPTQSRAESAIAADRQLIEDARL